MRWGVRLATAALVIITAFPTAAFAQYVGGTPPSAGPDSDAGEVVKKLRDSAVAAETIRVVSSPAGDIRLPESRGGGGLAVTGGDIVQLSVLAGVCGAAGLLLLSRSRRRTRPS